MEHIRKEFGEKTALVDVSCTVKKQEIYGLLGPSGAGKTTIINILTGQLPQTAGTAYVFGIPTHALGDDSYRNIGMVLDNSGLYTRLSTYDNLALFAKIHNIDKAHIQTALEQVSLTEAAKRPVHKLSKGMAQRLRLARAILHQPQLLFLDEPTSGLDPVTSQRIHQLIFSLRENGTTVFLTTHNMEEATLLCDNVSLLNEGTIVEYGPPDALCRKYNTQNNIHVLLKDGREVSLPNGPAAAQPLQAYLEEDMIAAIHSSEPTLETVFIALTGRELV
ncbi:ABC transporter ATP-binding protein [Eubacteriales bacterium OttesenSCG-928-M02]|nr:ABC transporter ATP-binding protein [Eubacteriales bacterium OttesenSCG-928-M02]